MTEAFLDVVGVFGYSDEDGTEAAGFPAADKHDPGEIRARVEAVSALVDELVGQRAEERIGERVQVLIESVGEGSAEGRADHQGPEVDGLTRLEPKPDSVRVGDLVSAVVVSSAGADLVATVQGGER